MSRAAAAPTIDRLSTVGGVVANALDTGDGFELTSSDPWSPPSPRSH